jgi:hypothetical protein
MLLKTVSALTICREFGQTEAEGEKEVTDRSDSVTESK